MRRATWNYLLHRKPNTFYDGIKFRDEKRDVKVVLSHSQWAVMGHPDEIFIEIEPERHS